MEDMEAKKLTMTPVKGKVEVEYLGHVGFKVQFMDSKNNQRVLYFDYSAEAKDCPEHLKNGPPNDCDLAFVTRGQLEHSKMAPYLMMAGKKDDRKIVCTTEVAAGFIILAKIPMDAIKKMQPGGCVNFGWIKIHSVNCDSSSTYHNT